MSFPFSIPEALGQGGPRTPQSPPPMQPPPDENTLPTFDFPITMTSVGGCTHDPQPEPGVFTLLGPLRYSRNKNDHDVVHEAILRLRRAGFIVNIVPNTTSPPSVASEYQYIEENWYLADNVKVFHSERDNPVAYISTRSSWINIRCVDRAAKTQLLSTLMGLFALASIEHKTCRLDSPNLPSEYYITVTSGNGPRGYVQQAIGSYFELKRDFGPHGENKKVIGKALCAYAISEIDMGGPTIEVLEIASEWQGRGLGSAFLKEMEKFFRNQFDSLRIAGAPVYMHCCNARPLATSRWFQRKGFRDQGFEEDLSKPLYRQES